MSSNSFIAASPAPTAPPARQRGDLPHSRGVQAFKAKTPHAVNPSAIAAVGGKKRTSRRGGPLQRDRLIARMQREIEGCGRHCWNPKQARPNCAKSWQVGDRESDMARLARWPLQSSRSVPGDCRKKKQLYVCHRWSRRRLWFRSRPAEKRPTGLVSKRGVG
jgi:hypothetical protein